MFYSVDSVGLVGGEYDLGMKAQSFTGNCVFSSALLRPSLQLYGAVSLIAWLLLPVRPSSRLCALQPVREDLWSLGHSLAY